MVIFLFLVPLLGALSTLWLYRHTGKKEFFKFDLVQFIYGFIVLPLLFVWLKSFLFVIMRRELEITLSVTELFIIDTFFSVLFLFVFAFVVIHSLTKTFSLKYERDPLYDIFEHSEYYHLWLSHVVMFGGIMAVISFLSVLNLWVPFEIALSKLQFYGVLLVGMVLGLVAYIGTRQANYGTGQFMRLMKLTFGLFFLIHVVAYLLFDPAFNAGFGFYWFTFMGFAMAVLCSFRFDRSERAVRLANKFKHR
jgi:hypothetical protein